MASVINRKKLKKTVNIHHFAENHLKRHSKQSHWNNYW